MAFMGDGAVNQGAVHEAYNLASLWSLPVVFVIENNGYSMGTSQKRSSAYDSCLAQRAEAYAIEWDVINGSDLYEVRAKTQIAMERARKEHKPTVLEIETYRYYGHSLSDPRNEALGWRHYGETDISDATDWAALNVAHLIPQTGIELTPDTYILEVNFEALHGVDFKKGCFVGQEIVARMKHKAELKKGLRRVQIAGEAQSGDEIIANGKPAGMLHTISGDQALAYLRFDRTTDMKTQKASLTLRD